MTNPDLCKALQAHSCCIQLQAQHMHLWGKCIYCAAQGDLHLGLIGEIFLLLKEPRSPFCSGRSNFNKFQFLKKQDFLLALSSQALHFPNPKLCFGKKDIQPSDYILFKSISSSLIYFRPAFKSPEKSNDLSTVVCDFLMPWKWVLHPAMTEQESLLEAGESALCTWTAKTSDLGTTAGVSGVEGSGICVKRIQPPLLTWNWCLRSFLVAVLSPLTGPRLFWCHRGCSGLLTLAAVVSPLPCSAARAERTLKLQPGLLHWDQGLGTAPKAAAAPLPRAPGTLRVTFPLRGTSSALGSASQSQSHEQHC